LDIVLLNQLLTLEDGLTHFDAGLYLVAPGNDTTVIVTKDENNLAV